MSAVEVAEAAAVRSVARHVAGQRRSCGGCKGRPRLRARRHHRAAPAAILSSERADAASSSRRAEVAGAQSTTTSKSSKLSNNIVPFSNKQIDDEYASDDEPECLIGDGGCGGIRGGRGGDDDDGNNNSPVVLALKSAFLRFTWLHVAAVHAAIVLTAVALGRIRASSQYYMLVDNSAPLPSVSGRLQCSHCQKSRDSDDMWFCAGCLQASYCNRTCQEHHWSQHSTQCSGAHAVPS
eukprot:jgi/Chlat1/8753/Chrsp9S08571